jgi:RIP metalloprotease RseP
MTVTDDAVVEPMSPDDYGRSGEPGQRATVGHPYYSPVRFFVLLGLLVLLATRGRSALLMVGALVVFIFMHELGHYVMARRAGMKVTEFMIGFGPRIVSIRRGETEYGLKTIPAGAYVKIIGMANVEEVPPEDEPRTYRVKSYPQRFGVAVAGSTMHFLMAIALLFVSYAVWGANAPGKWAVNEVVNGSAASVGGIHEDDEILSIDGTPTPTFAAMAQVAKAHPSEKVDVVIRRDGKRMTLPVKISPRVNVYGTVLEDLVIYSTPEGSLHASVVPGGDVAASGLRESDTILAVDGTQVATVEAVSEALSAAKFKSTGEIPLTVRRGADSVDLTVNLGHQVEAGPVAGFLGVGPKAVQVAVSVPEAARKAVVETGRFGWTSMKGVVHFFSPSNLTAFADRAFSTRPGQTNETKTATAAEVAADQTAAKDSSRIVSVVGAVVAGEQLTETGWQQFLVFLALLNISIGIINLVPLPPFDGGLIAIATYERIRELFRRDGRRYFADANKIMPVAVTVVAIMLVVGLMAIYLDLADPVRF